MVKSMPKRIILLIKSNIRKSKKTSVAFMLLVLLVAMLLHTGSQFTKGFNQLFLEKSIDTNSADFAATLPYDFCKNYQSELKEFLKEKEKIENIEFTDAFLLKNADICNDSKENINGTWTFRNVDRQEKVSNVKIVERIEETPINAIYIPYVCKTFFGYELGDTISIWFKENEETFIIAGFTEDVLFGSRSYLAFDLPQEKFYELQRKVGAQNKATIVMIKGTEDVEELSDAFTKFVAERGDNLEFYSNTDKIYAKESRTSNISVYMIIIKIASYIGMFASFSIIGFHMRNTLEKDAKEIGVLKAIGYTGGILVSSYVIQFLILGLVGAFIGIAGSVIIFPMLVSNIAADIGFQWGFTLLGSFVLRDVFVMLSVIGIVTLILSMKIFKLRPVEAFQDRNISLHNRKNKVTIERVPFSIDIAIVLKMLSYEKVKGIFIILIVMIAMCVSGFSVVLYARLVKDEKGLLQITGAEVYSVNVQPANLEEIQTIVDEIKDTQVQNVITAIEPGTSKLLCEDNVYAALTVYSDYDLLKNPSIYEGRYPKHENEVAISGNVSQALNKKIGDTIKVAQIFQNEKREEEYLIVGLTQGTYTGGMDIFFTMKGLLKIEPTAQWQSIHIYLQDSICIDKYCDNIKAKFGNRLTYVENYESIFYSQFNPIVNSVASIVGVIQFIMLLIVVVMGFFVTNSVLLTRKTDFGIMKALGYTTNQMIKQLALTFMVYIAEGSMLSTIVLYFFSDFFVEKLFATMGVHRINFQIPFVWLLILFLCVEIIGCITATLSARKVKCIVPCNLIKSE